MHDLHLNPPVLVGIDGSDDGLRALDWAAQTVTPRGWDLRLVHASEPDMFLLGMSPPVTTADLDAASSEAMLDAGRLHLAAHHQVPGAVSSTTLFGPAIPALLSELDAGRMLVLGRRGAGRFAELAVGSTSAACAAHAGGPVVVVPATWGAARPPTGIVVLGVQGSHLCEEAVAFAFDEASWRGAELDVVSTWRMPTAYAQDLSAWDGLDAWQSNAERAASEAIAGWREKYPDVAVTVRTVPGHPVEVLVAASAVADLVVLGGHAHSELLGMLAGSTVQAVLHHAACPVAVVHTPAAH